ncbi:hypothetical protein HPB51_024591 [Rhipicephalus microplus]|uniref:Uncharacterized protein n=1 Tax=Rhipicephalus microplus TaxID=6941 RepID=A0A9J6EDN3_RHIMP|nr:hypothetical protein HPB51_024591 [Rhipicephalus microplus]
MGLDICLWVPFTSLVTPEPGLPATYYLPWPCVADVLRLQGILYQRTRGAVGLRARVPTEVSGQDAAGGGAYPSSSRLVYRARIVELSGYRHEFQWSYLVYYANNVIQLEKNCGILCQMTCGAVRLRARVLVEVSDRDVACGGAYPSSSRLFYRASNAELLGYGHEFQRRCPAGTRLRWWCLPFK